MKKIDASKLKCPTCEKRMEAHHADGSPAAFMYGCEDWDCKTTLSPTEAEAQIGPLPPFPTCACGLTLRLDPPLSNVGEVDPGKTYNWVCPDHGIWTDFKQLYLRAEEMKAERDGLLEWEAECKAASPSSGADLSPGDWVRQIRVYLHWQSRPGIQQEHRYFELRRIVGSAISETEAERDRLRGALEGIAQGDCCSPACAQDDPMCDPCVATKALEGLT